MLLSPFFKKLPEINKPRSGPENDSMLEILIFSLFFLAIPARVLTRILHLLINVLLSEQNLLPIYVTCVEEQKHIDLLLFMDRSSSNN